MANRIVGCVDSLAERYLAHPMVPPPYRRLTDKLLIVFHHACDGGELDVAEYILRLLELMVSGSLPSPAAERRMSVVPLVAANDRLWLLRNPGEG